MGQQATNAFSDMNDALDKIDWYLYPIEIQRMLVPVMIYSQKPALLEFFGSIACSREQFKKV